MELIKVEENTLIVAEKYIEQIKDFERKRKLIEEKEQDFKEQLLKAMEEHNLKSYESPDKSLKITYIPESLSTHSILNHLEIMILIHTKNF